MAVRGQLPETVILTGAGVSAESGLGTFRDVGGIWSQYALEDVATPEGYARDPELVLSFYNARRANALAATPNPAHDALARLLKAKAGEVVLITQNIDDLHERAGSEGVLHMHGELLRGLCTICGARCDWRQDMHVSDACPSCGGVGGMRPDVVWFGEIPYFLEEIATMLQNCRQFVAIGTSGSVYPAAGFVAEARAHGAETLEINLERSEVSSAFERRILGPASETVPEWVESLLN
ncbi:MAG: NAD-dependent deacylase [Pseudomonadota bacterium]